MRGDEVTAETATQRGDRTEAEAIKAARPILRAQLRLALGLAGRVARDRAAGVSEQVAWCEAIDAGLDRGIADYVMKGGWPRV